MRPCCNRRGCLPCLAALVAGICWRCFCRPGCALLSSWSSLSACACFDAGLGGVLGEDHGGEGPENVPRPAAEGVRHRRRRMKQKKRAVSENFRTALLSYLSGRGRIDAMIKIRERRVTMELIKSRALQYATVSRASTSHEESLDAIVPDTFPDIETICCALVRWRSGKSWCRPIG